MTTHVAVFASGGGSNFQALVDAVSAGRINAEISVLIASRKDAGAVERAAKAGIKAVVIEPTADEAHADALIKACKDAGVTVVCLAGWVHHVPPKFLREFPNRVINIHPSLLPAFGGKGMYGMRVHQAVIESGTRITGATVHLVDEHYDQGPIVLQQSMPVTETDTVESVASRVLDVEHQLYPRALGLFCDDRVEVDGRRVRIKPAPASERVQRALLSVSDKEGIVDFARALAAMGVEILSTGGTARALTQAGINVRSVESFTGSPEMLDGRVKTLHPRVHGALLFRREDAEHRRQVSEHQLEPIDLVVVNLYPFAQAAQKHAAFTPELIEEIDIGGPSMLRSAAKNCAAVTVVTDPADYNLVLTELQELGNTTLKTRQELALKVYRTTASYDGMIANKLAEGQEGQPELLEVRLRKVQDLRYGENPHQSAALYRPVGEGPAFTQLQGKELSYNNILDAEGSWEMVQEFKLPAAVIFKHVTPCGAGTGANIVEAYKRALETDPVCAFGGILAVNGPLDGTVAHAIGDLFLEVIIAPSFTEDALEILKRKKNLRLLARPTQMEPLMQHRVVGREVLVQQPDTRLFPDGDPWKVVTRRAPTDEETQGLRFAWPVCKHVKSNAIVVTSANQAVGLGAGQMSRVDSAEVAGIKLRQFAARQALPQVLVAGSDAFFPFRDGLDGLKALGVSAIIQPGGSVRDAEVIAAADEHGMAMVFTGMRHFRH